MAILFHCPWNTADQWLAAFQAAMPNDEFRIYPDLGKVEEIDVAMVWRLPHGVLSGLPNLLGVCSLGAGVDALLEDPDLPRNIPIARLVDPLMMDRMAEYVCAAVLHHHLGFDDYNEQQTRQFWQRNPTTDARDRTVALLGMGQMGQRCAERLGALGFKLIGWSRGPKKIDGVKCFHGWEQLDGVLQAASIVVILLPSTKQTINLFDRAALNAMQKDAFLINCSRGEIVVEDDLISALDSGHLSGATLDAFRREPLPYGHPLWKHSKICVTPHIASLSAPDTAAVILADQLRCIRNRQSVANTVNFEQGY